MLKSSCITPSLQLLLKLIIKLQLGQESIGQYLVKATTPRIAIPPIFLCIGISLDNVFGSKWLVDEPFCFGFF